MCVYLFIHNKYTKHAHMYYANKNFNFGRDKSFDSTKYYSVFNVIFILLAT